MAAQQKTKNELNAMRRLDEERGIGLGGITYGLTNKLSNSQVDHMLVGFKEKEERKQQELEHKRMADPVAMSADDQKKLKYKYPPHIPASMYHQKIERFHQPRRSRPTPSPCRYPLASHPRAHVGGQRVLVRSCLGMHMHRGVGAPVLMLLFDRTRHEDGSGWLPVPLSLRPASH